MLGGMDACRTEDCLARGAPTPQLALEAGVGAGETECHFASFALAPVDLRAFLTQPTGLIRLCAIETCTTALAWLQRDAFHTLDVPASTTVLLADAHILLLKCEH
jgi:hypothetical protein